MQDCQVCGRSFDPLAFQVVVPELGRGFDRMECAQHARMAAPSGSAVAAAPLVALVEPFTAAAVIPAAAAAPVLGLAGVPLATLGLLAAGTVSAVYLWLHVLGAAPTSFPLSRGFVPPATHRESVQAHVQILPAGTARRVGVQTERRKTATVAVLAAAASFSPTAFRRPALHSVSGPTRHLLSRAAAPAHGKAKGKGHAKHSTGHLKHGKSGGGHNAGHGVGAAKSGKHGGGKGHSKKKNH